MRFDKKSPLKSDKKAPPKAHKKGVAGYNRKTALLEEAITHMNAGKYGRSSAALKELLALDPLNTEARRLFATLHLRLGSLISARTAFESLAREALERQDFWLAESLLREYLTAGPRYVPFLVMLGQLYEEKGDAMSAVAEYGKAIEVLVEDPDPDNPDRGAELFAKIRALAPHSSVVSRVAALFDPTTGQLRVTPQPTTSTSDEERGIHTGGESDGAEDLRNSSAGLWGTSSDVRASSSSLPVEEPAVSPIIDGAISPPAASPEVRKRPHDETRDVARSVSPTGSPSDVPPDQPFKFVDETGGTSRRNPVAKPRPSHGATQPEGAFSFQRHEAEPQPVAPKSGQTHPVGVPGPADSPIPAVSLAIQSQGLDSSTVSVADRSAAVVDPTPVGGPETTQSHRGGKTEEASPVQPPSSSVLPTLPWEEVLKALQGQGTEQASSSSLTEPLEESDRNETNTPGPDKDSEPVHGVHSSAALATDDALSASSDASSPLFPILQHESEPDSIVDVKREERPVPEDRCSLEVGKQDQAFDDPGEERLADMPEVGEVPSMAVSELSESPPPPLEEQARELSPALQTAESPEISMEELSASMGADDAVPPGGDGAEESIETSPKTVESAQPVMAANREEVRPRASELPPVLAAEPKHLTPEADTALRGKDPSDGLADPACQVEEDVVSSVVPVEDPTGDLAATACQVEEEVVSSPELESVELPQASEEAPAAIIDPHQVSPELDAQLQPGATSDSMDEPVQKQPTAVKPASNEIRILWDPSLDQSATDQAGLGLLKRWLRRSAMDESRGSTGAQVPSKGASTPASSTPVMSVGPSPIHVLLGTQGTSSIPHSEPTSAKRKPQETRLVRLYKRVKWDVLFVCRTCFSTTRSMTISLLSLVLAVVLVAAIGVGTTGLAWLVMEQQPSPAYRALTALPERTLKDASTNGYLMLLGFDAGPNQDPMQASLGRRPDNTDLTMTQNCLLRPEERGGASQAAGDRMLAAWQRDADPAARFGAQGARIKAWVEQADRWMGRYKQWLTMPFEDWGYGEPISPNCQLILRTHRLFVAEGFAKDTNAGMDRLETDLTRWRQVMSGARSLPIKMLAADAIADDVAIMSGLLAHPDLDDQLLARLMKLARPLDEAESSLRWPMQSELARGTKVQEMLLDQDATDHRPLHASLASALPLPKQRRLNDYADYYEASSKVGGDKLFANLPKRSAFVRNPAEGLIDYGVNPIENLVGLPPLPAWDTYSGRILSVDAQLRLSGLQAWIGRSRREQDVLTRIAKAGQALYDPFTGFPMLVNRRSGRIYSVGEDGQDNDGQAGRDITAAIPLSAGALHDAIRQTSSSKSRS